MTVERPAGSAPVRAGNPPGRSGHAEHPAERSAPVRYTPERTGTAGYVPERRIVLVDLLDRLLAGGVVVSGDLTLSIADVDLVTISLRVLITSVSGQDVLDPAPRDRT